MNKANIEKVLKNRFNLKKFQIDEILNNVDFNCECLIKVINDPIKLTKYITLKYKKEVVDISYIQFEEGKLLIKEKEEFLTMIVNPNNTLKPGKKVKINSQEYIDETPIFNPFETYIGIKKITFKSNMDEEYVKYEIFIYLPKIAKITNNEMIKKNKTVA